MKRLTLAVALAVLAAPRLSAQDKTVAPLPKAVSSFGAAALDGWLYVYGGHCGKTHTYSTEDVLNNFRRINLAEGKTWEDLPAGPASQGLALVAHAGKLYRAGGMQPRNAPGEPNDNYSLKTCAVFDPASKTWSALPDLPEGRSSHDAIVVGDKLYVMGGWGMSGATQKPHWHDTALVLNLREPTRWDAIAQPFQRRALTIAAHDNKIYVFGGLGAEKSSLDVIVYDPAAKTWTPGPKIPGFSRNGFTPASCVAGGKLYLSPADGSLLRLDVAGKAWEQVGELKQPRLVHRLVAAGDNRLLAIGGVSKAGNVAEIEVLTPAAQGRPPIDVRPSASN